MRERSALGVSINRVVGLQIAEQRQASAAGDQQRRELEHRLAWQEKLRDDQHEMNMQNSARYLEQAQKNEVDSKHHQDVILRMGMLTQTSQPRQEIS